MLQPLPDSATKFVAGLHCRRCHVVGTASIMRFNDYVILALLGRMQAEGGTGQAR